MTDEPIVNAAIEAKNRFLKSLRHTRGIHESFILECLRENESTAFGRAHGFSRITSSHTYRRTVPIRTYDDLAHWLRRAQAGEPAVLTAAPPLVFLRSTGTTAEPKKIPMTKRRVEEIRNNVLFRVAAELDACPDIPNRMSCCLSLTRAPRPFVERTSSGIPIHPLTALPTRLSEPPVLHWRAPWWTPPPDLGDSRQLYYYVRFGIEADLRIVRCLHPSRFLALASLMAAQAPALVRDVHDGVLFGRTAAAPNPERARELEAILRRDGTLTPRAVWPALRALFCWTGGHAAALLGEVRAAFGTDVRPTDISSTEVGAMTRPFEGEDGLLAVDKCFWEFVPADGDVAASSPTLLFDELEIGSDYVVIATTPWGLYRYDTQDVVRVVGRRDGVPRLTFVARAATADLTGEKLTEHHVMLALESTWRELGTAPVAYACVPCQGHPARYVLLVEWSPHVPPHAGTALDGHLKKVNHRYALQRNNGELGQAMVEPVPAGGFAHYREQLVAMGAVAAQFKERVLHLDDRMRRFFNPETGIGAFCPTPPDAIEG